MEPYEQPICLVKVSDGFKIGEIRPGGIYPIDNANQIVIIGARRIALPEWWEAL
jgi:hypothetical protein